MNQYDYEDIPERDSGNNNPGGLPTYDYLEDQERANPNSRFGRWKGWVEKRAAERYADDTHSTMQRRRNRGWDLDLAVDTNTAPQYSTTQNIPQVSTSRPPQLTIAADRLHPTHLSLYSFGSRFLPHAIQPINTLLPLVSDRYILIGDNDGLSMLDVLPENEPLSADASVHYLHALEPAKRREIWTGESVYQLAILESTPSGSPSPEGVVMALVGVETDGVDDPVRSVRMYNLASLISLTTWIASRQDAKPVEFHHAKHWGSHTSPKKLQKSHHGGIGRSFRAFKEGRDSSPVSLAPSSLNSPFRSPHQSATSLPPQPRHQDSTSSSDSAWEVVDELPLRWATDYVSLATPGSRLANATPLFFKLWKNDTLGGRGTAMLAIATKTNILLYETPKGERAFRFVKEFYTPMTAKSLSFVQQAAANDMRPSSSTLSPNFEAKIDRSRSLQVSADTAPRLRRVSTPGDFTYGSQLSLFVVFERKAGLIRISDSAVGEIELYDDGPLPTSPTTSTHSSFRRSIQLDAFGFGKDTKGAWLPLVNLQVPSPNYVDEGFRNIVLLSRGKQTHIYRSPMPVPISSSPPLRAIIWNHVPSSISARVHYKANKEPVIQVIAMGESGMEIAESSLNFLYTTRKGKAKETMEPLVRTFLDQISPSGSLYVGGDWHTLDVSTGRAELAIQPQPGSADSLEGFEWHKQGGRVKGIYGWYKKGRDDYRVFWLGDEPESNANSVVAEAAEAAEAEQGLPNIGGLHLNRP